MSTASQKAEKIQIKFASSAAKKNKTKPLCRLRWSEKE
jgi:hypothetical protein